MQQNSAYISVIQWPDAFTVDHQVAALARAMGTDPFHAKQRVVKGTPMVAGRLATGGPAEWAVAALRKFGAMVFAPTDAALAGVGPAPTAKRLIAGAGSGGGAEFMCEMWRAEARLLRCADIFLIVRARVKQVETSAPNVEVDYHHSPLSPAIGSIGAQVHVTRSSSAKLRELVDVYLKDGSRVRIDSGKFNFDCLGKARGYSDNENTDKLCLALGRAAPKAMLDTGYNEFNCPLHLIKGAGVRTSHHGATKRDDSPVFDFYSVWAYLMYCEMLGGGAH